MRVPEDVQVGPETAHSVGGGTGDALVTPAFGPGGKKRLCDVSRRGAGDRSPWGCPR